MTERDRKNRTPRKGRPTRRTAPPKLDDATKAEMHRLMEDECLRKAAARRIATEELSLSDFKLRYPAEYAVSYRAKHLLVQHAGMTRARAFWLAEDPTRIEEMRQKQIRTFATQTGLSYEISRDIATGKTSLSKIAEGDKRWAFIWDRAKARIKSFKDAGDSISPMDAIRWSRGDSGLEFAEGEDEDELAQKAKTIHDKFPFLKKRHASRMARFDLSLSDLATVSPANCGWATRAEELWTAFPGHHRKFVRLMAMMDLNDEEAAAFVASTEPARTKYRELATSDRSYFFKLYDGDKVAQLVPDDNPFAWRLKADGDEVGVKQAKLHVLFFCVANAKEAIERLIDYDIDLRQQQLGPAFKAEDRLEIDTITAELEKAKRNDRQARITLRNGQVFTGHVAWYSPFELQLRLSNNAWVLILFHAIRGLENIH